MFNIQFLKKNTLQMALSIMFNSFTLVTQAQKGFTISGRVTEAVSGKLLQNARMDGIYMGITLSF